MALTLNRQSKLNRQSNGLKRHPVLYVPAITLTSQCYKQMFSAFKNNHKNNRSLNNL